jgi:hypothetical protein
MIKLCRADSLEFGGPDPVTLDETLGCGLPMGHGRQRQARGAPTNLRLQRSSGHFQHYLWRPRTNAVAVRSIDHM